MNHDGYILQYPYSNDQVYLPSAYETHCQKALSGIRDFRSKFLEFAIERSTGPDMSNFIQGLTYWANMIYPYHELLVEIENQIESARTSVQLNSHIRFLDELLSIVRGSLGPIIGSHHKQGCSHGTSCTQIFYAHLDHILSQSSNPAYTEKEHENFFKLELPESLKVEQQGPLRDLYERICDIEKKCGNFLASDTKLTTFIISKSDRQFIDPDALLRGLRSAQELAHQIKCTIKPPENYMKLLRMKDKIAQWIQ